MRVIIKELRELDARCLELEEVCGYPISLLEYGPGFSISYFDGQEDTLLRDVETAAETVRTMQWQGNVVFEMGRALAASCGYYLTQVYETKQTGGYDYCIVDGGLHQMNYDGQMLGMVPAAFPGYPRTEEGKWSGNGPSRSSVHLAGRPHPQSGPWEI